MERAGDGGKDNLHENIFQKLHPDKLKMQQKAFGGRASPGPTGESLSAPPDSLAAMRGPTITRSSSGGVAVRYVLPV